jgi:glycosyltransferase involved in cell wall biosynthesis
MEISVVIIAKNEGRMIDDCLKSVKWVDEILVVDTGSVDETIDIAKKYKARVVKYTAGKNFSDWRNRGLKEAKGKWVLYVDADERIPDDLKKEILSVIPDRDPESIPIDSRLRGNDIVAYAIPRRNFMFGREVKHIAVPPDYVKRLFKKSTLKEWSGKLHEEPQFSGELGHLQNPMIHEKHETFSEMVEKTNKWSEIEAKLMFEAGHPPMNIPRFLTAILREFWTRMVVHKAFLDGKIGIIYAMYQVFSRFTSYAKLWELQNKQSLAKQY